MIEQKRAHVFFSQPLLQAYFLLHAIISALLAWASRVLTVIFIVCLIFIFPNKRYPFLAECIVRVFLAEYNRFAIERRRNEVTLERCQNAIAIDMEKGQRKYDPNSSDVLGIAAVVGYREDPDIYRKAVESYRGVRGVGFTLAGIDGDEEKDMEMVRIFRSVNPESTVIHLKEPMANIARQFERQLAAETSQEKGQMDQRQLSKAIIEHCCNQAGKVLRSQNVVFDGPNRCTHLCIYEPHLHKKGIMFTIFIFSMVISEATNLEYLWSSDSDSFVYESTIYKTFQAMAADKTIGGASTSMGIHNAADSIWTTLAELIYWSEVDLIRSVNASCSANDCQSGPCAAFRISAMAEMLHPWYNQTVFGTQMIMNEDRHLTTNLLLNDHKVLFISDAVTATETPHTLARWILQQTRWGRAIHVETLLSPRIYTKTPVFFLLGAIKRTIGPFVVASTIATYAFTGKAWLHINMMDLATRLLLTLAYNLLRNVNRQPIKRVAWFLAAEIFYYIPMPAIHAWSLFTILDNGWGTALRTELHQGNGIAQSRRKGAMTPYYNFGFFIVWIGIVGAAVGRRFAVQFELSPLMTHFVALGGFAALTAALYRNLIKS